MIALLLSRVEAGGLERVQFNLARGLVDRGHSVRIVAGRLEGAAPCVDEVHFIAPSGAWQFLWRLLGWIRRNRPAVIVTTSNDVAVWVLLWRRWLYADAEVIVTQHLAISGPRLAARGVRWVKLACIRWAMARLLPSADAIVAVSAAVAADMRAELGLDGISIDVIHNPIVAVADAAAPDLPCPEAWPFPRDGVPVLVFVGRLAPEKRLDLLFAAFMQVRATLPVRLLVLGAGPIAAQLEQWRQDAGVGIDCRLMGQMQDVLPWIANSDILVLPSDYEGFGNVLVEAMQCATQIVATDCPSGPAEILDHGRFGQLVAVGDAAALAVALRRSLDGSFRVERDALLARSAEFSIDRAVDAYERVFTAKEERVPPSFQR
ncbi:glycosyltransferase [Stenotrophomonas rhizophila]|uniref:glycosyltransferase n=1 Tax=Stenotrophomonas rhizophila TaxID=216778 RepID=UPI001E40D8B6|nr:glycosyltransferase [Stenotrophomonas rhizophila]MCC7635775.1 glycosyltransferase [Stenotrophomonas rhizophila]MCC7665042.1 glycosyltransferase [Stenotrophomonas rhizophila]